MGVCGSNLSYEDQISSDIEKVTVHDQKKDKDIKKFLLLGAGESGKSTIFKQLTDIYGKGYSQDERLQFVNVVYNNTISSMKTMVHQARIVGQVEYLGRVLDCTIPSHLEKSAAFFDTIQPEERVTQEVADHIRALWADESIQNVYKIRSLYQLPDACDYFVTRLDDFIREDYVPTMEDILRGRVRTTGIVETNFSIDGHSFRVTDVGGQRNERRKWIHCFEGVTAVIFVAAISEYDQQLFEDAKRNRMRESLDLFSEICNSRWFQNTSMILFLNKRDLFQEKLQQVPISVFFDDYSGPPHDFEASCTYIRARFEELNKNENKEVYTHITCATDRNNVDRVFLAAKDIVFRSSLRQGGLL